MLEVTAVIVYTTHDMWQQGNNGLGVQGQRLVESLRTLK